MALMTLETAVTRIRMSDADLAVFAVDWLSEAKVNVVFSDTVRTHQWIAKGRPRLLGVFNRKSKEADVLSKLKSKRK